ncbi:MAG: iron ABC transporter permease [Planctomycetota bacterium]
MTPALRRRSRLLATAAAMTAAAVVLVPVGVVLSTVFQDGDGAFAHIASTRLGLYAGNTTLLVLGVVTLAVLLGVPPAWLVTMHEFQGRRTLSWLLLLPLAVPGYIAAYALTDLLQPAGPLRAIAIDAGSVRTWWPRVRTLPGATCILAFSLYPYVYVAARAAFLALPSSLLDASRTLGRTPLSTFARVAIPVSAPTIAAGTLLVVMETVADFGAADYCAVDTFATGVYRAWATLASPVAAGQLASVLLAAIFAVMLVLLITRGRKRFHADGARTRPPTPTRLPALRASAAVLACLVPIAGGFIAPVGWLAYLAATRGDARARELLLDHGGATAGLAAAAAAIAVLLGLVLVAARRWSPGAVTRAACRTAQLGYAVPGTVLGVGVLAAVARFDHGINDAASAAGLARPGLLLGGTIAAVLLGYQARFVSVSSGLLAGAMDRVPPRLDEAARTLGAGGIRALVRVQLPLLRPALLAAALLVFVDVAKELPMTLMLRPFGLDTLAVRVYQLASDERLDEASTGALAIIAVGLLPVATLAASMGGRRGRDAGDTA